MRKQPYFRARLLLSIISFALILFCWKQIASAKEGLIIRQWDEKGVPLRFIAPENHANDMPGVLIAHGFSGSQQLMLGYAYTLAHAGYGVMLWDVSGHGQNENKFTFSERSQEQLLAELDIAYIALQNQPEINNQTALIGHSMGSGIVMASAIKRPYRYRTTIAISPTDADVNQFLPLHLLLMAGSLEAPFVKNAQQLLEKAGGQNDTRGQSARELIIIPNVEHISILFSHQAQSIVVKWLAFHMGRTAEQPYTDWRIVWYALQLIASLCFASAFLPLLGIPTLNVPRKKFKFLPLPLAPLLATLLLWGLSKTPNLFHWNQIFLPLPLSIWFFILGIIWLLFVFPPQQYLPHAADIGLGLLMFAILWLSFGLLGDQVWLPWLLVPERFQYWPLISLALFPWLLATSFAQLNLSRTRRFFFWLTQTIFLVAGLISAVYLIPSLFFIMILIPTIPFIFALLAISDGILARPWASALANASFLGWLLIAIFALG